MGLRPGGARRNATVWERLTTACRPASERITARRPLRRLAAVVALVGYPALLVGIELPALLGRDLPAVVVVATVLVLVVLWAGSWGVVYEFRRRLANASDDQLDEAIVTGSPEGCGRRLSEIAESFQLELPVADLSGLPHDAARRAIDALASRKTLVDSNTW